MVKLERGSPKKVAPPHNLGQKTMKRDHEELRPGFFKVYSAEMYSESMRIPPDFIENFGGNVPEIVTLIETSSGISFQVDVNKIEECWFLEHGWPQFVKENSVEEGDFMTFSYAGNSVFYVRIFAINGCIKGICDATDDEASDQSENSEDNGSYKRKPRPTMPLQKNTKGGNRYFSVVMKDSWILHPWMYIPRKFSRAYLNMDEGGSRMATLWIKKKSWEVKITTVCSNKRFSKGWSKFVADNSLRTGDLCTFRLFDGSDSAFRVTVE